MQDDIVAIGPRATWTDVPTSILQAELLRRQDGTDRPQCGSRGARQEYNTPLHVFALFLILTLSTFACSFPIVVRRIPRISVPHHFLFLSRHFGTGVLIATGFVHLLPTAFTSLTDPCLPSFWNEGYPAMAGFIAMISVMVVVGVEMFFATKGAGHSHGDDFTEVGSRRASTHGTQHGGQNGSTRPTNKRNDSLRRFKQGQIGLEGASEEGVVLEDAARWGDGSMTNGQKRADIPPTLGVGDHDDGDSGSDLDLDELESQDDRSDLLPSQRRRSQGTSYTKESNAGHTHGAASPSHLSEHQQQQKMLLQCLLLEAGILFHSIFIGMALSVATGTSFIVLLVAISFHQTFEGLALGSRIAAITTFPQNSPRPWLMALAYGTTTPVGQAIGLLVHNLYDPYSQMGLLMVGVMNAISSGLLLFAGLVELLAEDFLSDHSYESLQGQKRLQACAAVVSGAMLMALVGAWA
ncbi:hypothetical protein MBLNU459_g4653t1 [Dothideomycetes sp. NU459]